MEICKDDADVVNDGCRVNLLVYKYLNNVFDHIHCSEVDHNLRIWFMLVGVNQANIFPPQGTETNEGDEQGHKDFHDVTENTRLLLIVEKIVFQAFLQDVVYKMMYQNKDEKKDCKEVERWYGVKQMKKIIVKHFTALNPLKRCSLLPS